MKVRFSVPDGPARPIGNQGTENQTFIAYAKNYKKLFFCPKKSFLSRLKVESINIMSDLDPQKYDFSQKNGVHFVRRFYT